MRFDVLTLFPGVFEGFLNESMIKKARERGLIVLNARNIRDNTKDKHQTADDSPFGGGPGMVMMAGPVIELLKEIKTKNSRTILMSPRGQKLTQAKVLELLKYEQLILICGHYEGIDERIMSRVDEEISIGDFVVTGGEIPAALLIDAVCRNIPGVVKEMDSVKGDSFFEGLLDFPHYTRPSDLNGEKVPEVLLNGNHEDIRKWRRKRSLEKTLFQRPDLLAKAKITNEDKELLEEIIVGQ